MSATPIKHEDEPALSANAVKGYAEAAKLLQVTRLLEAGRRSSVDPKRGTALKPASGRHHHSGQLDITAPATRSNIAARPRLAVRPTEIQHRANSGVLDLSPPENMERVHLTNAHGK
jgi:hypothetical protein